MVGAAVERGIASFDTAEVYGPFSTAGVCYVGNAAGAPATDLARLRSAPLKNSGAT